MADGYIKLDRCLLHKNLFQNEKLLKTWVWCLLKARHSEGEVMVGLQKLTLQPGQFYTGRFNAGTELRMNPSTAWMYLKQLEANKSIIIKSNNKFSVVTIVNWEFYQLDKYNPDNKMTTKSQQNDTNKNVKKEKKKEYAEFVFMTELEYQKLVDKYGENSTKKMVEKLDNFKGAKGTKYKSDYRAILKWVVDAVGAKPINSNPSGPDYSEAFGVIET